MPKKKRTNNKQKRKKRIIKIVIALILIVVGIYIYLSYFNTKEEKNLMIENKKKLMVVDEDSKKRPIAVMIDNSIGNSLHAGLQESYLNYEIIVEGGLTRIMALFKDKNIDEIGPVRSSRHYFLDYALESDCIYAHYGWSTFAENDIKNLNVNNINGLYDENVFWRNKNISSPHNVFTSVDKIYKNAQEKNYSLKTDSWKLLNYTTEEVNLNKETKEQTSTDENNYILANMIKITYSYYQTRSYEYDSTRKVYLRFMNNEAHIDKNTNEQLYYKNIIVEQVENKTIDSYGRQDLNTTGEGKGYYITNGYAMPIVWNKKTRKSKTEYTYLNGEKVKFNDGNTFIQIQPNNYETTIE